MRHVYEHSIRGFAVILPNEKALAAILRNPSVNYVQPDVKVKAFSQTLPTGVNRVDGDLSATKSGDGTGSVDVDIAVLDTGIDLSHQDLNVYKQTTFVSGTSSGNDDMGHGTSVAGITAAKDDSNGVVGMAPGARLWAVKVLDKNGQGFMSDIIAGIEYVTDNAGQIDVVNLSFGGDGPNDALHTAIINSVKAGVTYVASAGNAGVDAASTVPANFPEVITVSAIGDFDGKCGALSTMTLTFGGKVNRDDNFASFSNYGSVVDLAAPGESIVTTQKGSTYRSDFSGTSASAPYVTGAATLYKSLHATATPSDVRTALMNSGSTPSTVCDDKGHGYFKGDPDGIAEPFLYVSASTDTTPPAVTSTIPARGATGIAATSVIKATFTEKVLGITVTTSTFILKNIAGASITGQVTSDGLTATFTPSSQLAFSTSYTATLSPSSTNSVKDSLVILWHLRAGHLLLLHNQIPHHLLSQVPSQSGGATGIAATSVIKATFNEKILGTTVTTSTFILKNIAGASITGQVTSDGLTATFTPSSQLAFSTSYTATLSPSGTNSVKDLTGNPMALKSWSFTTAELRARQQHHVVAI